MQIVILNDGTTWTTAEGCVLATVSDDFVGDANSMAGVTETMPVIGDIPVAEALSLMLTAAAHDRDDVNARHFPTEQKRAVANVYTKLKEAQMWMREAEEYYTKR